jgi:predicted ATP-grasp superfamily ATP-dependent carboligase
MTTRNIPHSISRLLIVGASVRPWIPSTALAGFEFSAFDLFADWDSNEFTDLANLHSNVRREQSKLFRLTSFEQILDIDHRAEFEACDGAIVCGGFETRIALTSKLAERLPILGTPANQLSRLLDPLEVESAYRRIKVPYPEIKLGLEAQDDPDDWIAKPVGSSGGTHIRMARVDDLGGTEFDGHFEKALHGRLLSSVFVSNKSDSQLIGMTRQLVGDSDFTKSQFQYCGSIECELSTETKASAQEIGLKIGAEFGLNGLWGIDFIETESGLVPIDINPRLTASMEIFESGFRFSGSSVQSMIDLHVQAMSGELDLAEFKRALDASRMRSSHFEAKGILFNLESSEIDVTERLHSRLRSHFDIQFFSSQKIGSSIADIPRVGITIAPGHPMLTVRVRTKRIEELENQLRRLVDGIRNVLTDG